MTEKHLTDHWPVAPGHELTQADWDAIKAAADEWAGRSDDGQWSVQIPAYVDITYPGAGGRKDSGATRQQLWVIHTAECPLQTGYAASLSRWGADSTVQASWHRMSDPATIARFVPVGRAAWHATWANWISIGYEQAGYAAFPRSTWLTDDGMASIDRLAQVIVADGIPADAVRVLTDAEVAAVKAGNTSIRGLCSHAQIQPADRTDPGAGYPWDVLLDRIRAHHPDIQGDDDMPITEAEMRAIANLVLNATPLDGPDAGVLSSWVKAARNDAGKALAEVKALRADVAKVSVGGVDVAALAEAVAANLAERMQS